MQVIYSLGQKVLDTLSVGSLATINAEREINSTLMPTHNDAQASPKQWMRSNEVISPIKQTMLVSLVHCHIPANWSSWHYLRSAQMGRKCPLNIASKTSSPRECESRKDQHICLMAAISAVGSAA